MNESKYQSADFSRIDLHWGMPDQAPPPRPDWGAILALTFVLLALLAGVFLALKTSAEPTTQPIGVWRQPAASAPKWKDRGVTVAICYESNNGTVTFKQWDAAWDAVGAKRIREPGADTAADDADPNLIGILCPIAEPDNAVVTAADNHQPTEPVYVRVETWAAQQKLKTPHKPLYVGIGLEQYRWRKADYRRLVAPFAGAVCDWYPVLRGKTPADLIALLQQFGPDVMTGKSLIVCIECSAQHLNDYPGQRCPTLDEFLAEMNGVASLGMGRCLFPQQIGEDGAVPFLYDAMPDPLVSALKPAPVQPQVSPATSQPVDLLAGHTVTVTIDGTTYVITKAK